MNGVQTLKKKLENCERISAATLTHLAYTEVPGMYKAAGTDCIIFDLEHGSFDQENTGDLLYACRKEDIPSIIRVQDCVYHCISKAIDMGADGVLIPRTETIEQVETAINSIRTYPRGKKGIGGRSFLRAGEDLDDFNHNRLLIIQIESPLGVQNLDEMLTKYGDEIAGVLIGPTDMACLCGCGLDLTADEAVKQELETVRICKKHNKSIGMFVFENDMQRWADAGMNIFWMTTETVHLSYGIKYAMDSFKELK